MFLVAGRGFALVLTVMQGTEEGGTGMNPLPQRGEEGCASVAQPLGEPGEPGACWKMTLGGKSIQELLWQVACDPHPEQLALAEMTSLAFRSSIPSSLLLTSPVPFSLCRAGSPKRC